jgi:hypothetical protein
MMVLSGENPKKLELFFSGSGYSMGVLPLLRPSTGSGWSWGTKAIGISFACFGGECCQWALQGKNLGQPLGFNIYSGMDGNCRDWRKNAEKCPATVRKMVVAGKTA